MHVAIALYKLANCVEYWVVMNQFGVQKYIVKTFVYMFCHRMIGSVISQSKYPLLKRHTKLQRDLKGSPTFLKSKAVWMAPTYLHCLPVMDTGTLFTGKDGPSMCFKEWRMTSTVMFLPGHITFT